MNAFLRHVQDLVAQGEVIFSDHAYDELAADGLNVEEICNGVVTARIVEAYPDYPKGPCVLVLQNDKTGKPVHVLWGMRKSAARPAVVVTAYCPDPTRWDKDFLRRLK